MFKKYFIYAMSFALLIVLIAPETNAQFRRRFRDRDDHKGRNTAVATGIGAGAGAIIGGLVGGGKGAGIGALVGGGAGAGGYLLKEALDDDNDYRDGRYRRFNNNSRRYYRPAYNDRFGRYHAGSYYYR